MPQTPKENRPRKNLEAALREARKRLASQPLFIVSTKHGYTISDEAPPFQQDYYRVNVDGSTTLMVPDHETGRLIELPGHPASGPNLTTTDLAGEEDASE